MHCTWLIEGGVYADEATPLIEEIRRQGMACDFVAHRSLLKREIPAINGRPLAPSDCVIGYGTFPFVRQIQLHYRWVPGAWCTSENLDCSTYYAYFGKYLLNQRYTILPGVEAIRKQDWLFSIPGADNEVFARPTGCHKLFVGRKVAQSTFAEALSPARYDPATLVLIAEPRPISHEWRLVVAEDRIVAASQYVKSGTRQFEGGCPTEVRLFTEEMLADVRWRPDPLFMIDVCESDGRLRVVELNSFSSSWLYRCDLLTVVATASELATKQWERGS